MFGCFVSWGFHVADYGSDWYNGLCSFSCAIEVGADGFFVLGILSFSCLWLDYTVVMFCVSFQYLVVGSFWIRWKLLSVINVCNFFGIFFGVYDYNCFSFVACKIIAFSITSFWFIFLTLYSCLFCVVLWMFSEINKGFEVKYT